MASGTIKNYANNSGANYCKMPDGTLIQWGDATIPAGGERTTVTFPIAFINANYTVSVIGVFANTRDVVFVYGAITTTNIEIWHSLTGTSFDEPFKWLAIGRWK